MKLGWFLSLVLLNGLFVAMAFAMGKPPLPTPPSGPAVNQEYKCEYERFDNKKNSVGHVYVGAGGEMNDAKVMLNFYVHDVHANPDDPNDYKSIGIDLGKISAGGGCSGYERDYGRNDRDDERDLAFGGDRKGYNTFKAGLEASGCKYRVYLPTNILQLADGARFDAQYEANCRGERKENATLSCTKEILR